MVKHKSYKLIISSHTNNNHQVDTYVHCDINVPIWVPDDLEAILLNPCIEDYDIYLN